MAGFEVIVRPVILPGIRPAPARSLPPADDPEKGICEIKGAGSHPISLSHSTSISWSQSKPKERERRVDEARIYQQDDDGTINRENFVDIEVANRITSDVPTPGDDGAGGTVALNQPDDLIQYYQPIQEAANIEVKRKNVIKRSGEEFSG